MNETIIGIIVCVAMIVCGMGAYFIGRCSGIEWAVTHLVEEEENGQAN